MRKKLETLEEEDASTLESLEKLVIHHSKEKDEELDIA